MTTNAIRKIIDRLRNSKDSKFNFKDELNDCVKRATDAILYERKIHK